MILRPFAIASALAMTAVTSTPAAAAPKKDGLIPRRLLFGNPERANAQISPDGKRIAYLAPVDGVMNIWVGPAGDLSKAKPVTKDTGRGIQIYNWALNNKHLLYQKDSDGDENFHLYRLDPETGEVTDLTPFPKVQARLQGLSHRHPDEILVGINNRNPQLHDIYRVNLKTAERERIVENPGHIGYVPDEDLNVRLALQFTPTFVMRVLERKDGKWEPLLDIQPEDMMTTEPVGFDKSGKRVYLMDSRGRDKRGLFELDLESGKSSLLAEDARADIGSVAFHPTEQTVQAVSVNYTREEWKALDPKVRADFDYLKTVRDGDFSIASRTLDDRTWLINYTEDDGPVTTYRYDRDAKKATFLFSSRPELEKVKLARMHPVVVKSRDGLDLVGYLTLPVNADKDGNARPNRRLPLVLWVHGGPWARDDWGYNPIHQWLANRGYAVLSVNYRGSTGFGKDFINKANLEWGRKMHEDLLDVVEWAVKEKIADPKKVAIAGGSYGGYATLAGLTLTPDRFACGVDLVGPSSLITLMQNVPPYWVPILPLLTSRVGDPNTEEGKKLLAERSPLTHVDRIRRPLLIGQGAQDPRVKQVEADQIVREMKEKKIPVTYLLYPDEGHGFVRPENRLSFFAVMEVFLAKHLGGKSEPIGDAFTGSSIQVVEGAKDLPELQKAAK